MGERPAGGSLSLRLQEAPVDETRYIVAARDGDDEARAWLVQRFTPPVFRFALRLLGDEQDARAGRPQRGEQGEQEGEDADGYRDADEHAN